MHSQTDGWRDADPGKGLTIQRGNLTKPDAEINLKWPAVIKRTEQLIAEGRYMTRAELDRLPGYERLMLVRNINSFYYGLPEEYERPFPGKTGFGPNEYRDENGEKILDFHYPHEAEWQAVRDLLDNPERVDALLGEMRRILENTPEEDWYYGSRKTAVGNLSAYREGTYTLFPGVENLPDPELAASRIRHTAPTDFNFDPAPPQATEQLSLFGGDAAIIAQSPLPILPGAEEQQRRIIQAQEQTAGADAPAVPVNADLDAALLDISDADKVRLAAQFSENPRSREAVALYREIYNGELEIPPSMGMKRITELVADGRFAVAEQPSIPVPVKESEPQPSKEWLEYILIDGGQSHFVKDKVYQYFISGNPDISDGAKFLEDVYGRTYVARAGNDAGPSSWESDSNGINSSGILRADWLEVARTVQALITAGVYRYSIDEFLEWKAAGREPVVENPAKPQYMIGNRIEYGGKLHEINRIDDSYVRLHNLGTPSQYPVFDYVSIPVQGFERMLSDGEIFIQPPEDIAADAEPGQPPLPILPGAEEQQRQIIQAPEQTGIFYTPENKTPYQVGDVIDRIYDNSVTRVKIDGIDDEYVHYFLIDDEPDMPRIAVHRARFEAYLDNGSYRLSVNQETELNPQYKIDDTVYLEGGKAFNITRIGEINGEVQLLDPTLYYPIFRTESKERFEWLLSRYSGNEQFPTPQADIEPTITVADAEAAVEDAASVQEEIASLDADTVEQAVYEWIMADAEYTDALANAASRGALRGPLNNALERAIAELEHDGRGDYRSFFTDDDFADDLFDFVYRQSWEQRPQAAAAPPQNPDDGFVEITDPAVLAGMPFYEGDQTSAERLGGIGGADYYLFHNPQSSAVLSHETLSLITEEADKYVVCADTCILSDSELEQINIVFRKLPRNFGILPEDVQARISEIKPQYSAQFREAQAAEIKQLQWELGRRGLVVSDELIENGVSEYTSRGGKGDFQDVADFIEDEYLTEEPDLEPQLQTNLPPSADRPRNNFRITDDHLGEGGAKTKFRSNMDAIKALQAIETEKRYATPDEQEILSRYVGRGDLPMVFDPDNKQWEREYAELKALLSAEEFESARASTLNAHPH